MGVNATAGRATDPAAGSLGGRLGLEGEGGLDGVDELLGVEGFLGGQGGT